MIDLCVTNRKTDDSDFKPICSNLTFDKYWRPPIKNLQLELLPYLPNMVVTVEYKWPFLAELERLALWAEANAESSPYIRSMHQTLQELAVELAAMDFEEFDISFG